MLGLKNIVLSRDGNMVLKGLSAGAKRGQVTVLLGANGTGKTSLLHLISGVLNRESGDITFDGAPVDPESKIWRESLTYVLDDGGTIPLLTVEEQLILQCSLAGIDREEAESRTRHVVELLELTHYRDFRADELSAGLKKKLGIAAAIIRDADVFLFDEPFSALDVQAMLVLRRILLTLKRRHKIIIIATHSFQLLSGLYDHLWDLSDGLINEYTEYEGSSVTGMPDESTEAPIPWMALIK